MICSTRPVPRRKQTEHQHQAALFKWSVLSSRVDFPELRLLAAVPNGGARDARTGAMLKAEGVRPGFPDMILPVARCGYHGAYLELKSDEGRVSKDQKWWHEELRAQGYFVAVCIGWDNAKLVLMAYLRGQVMREYEPVNVL